MKVPSTLMRKHVKLLLSLVKANIHSSYKLLLLHTINTILHHLVTKYTKCTTYKRNNTLKGVNIMYYTQLLEKEGN